MQDLRAWWLEHATQPATRRVGEGTGRNDPLPCGSGKKFRNAKSATAPGRTVASLR